MSADEGELARVLEGSLSADSSIRKAAEKQLENASSAGSVYPSLLMSIILKDGYQPHVQTSAAIMFKNLIKKNWSVEDNDDVFTAEVRNEIKAAIVKIMLKSEGVVQKLLTEVVATIGFSDFPDQWPSLMPELVSFIDLQKSPHDLKVWHGVLQTADSLFVIYRTERQSNELFKEILYVIKEFAEPYTLLTQQLSNSLQEISSSTSTTANLLTEHVDCLRLCASIFLSLNSQDLVEFFEDKLTIWMEMLLFMLKFDHPLLKDGASEYAPGPLEELRTVVIEIASFFTTRYSPEFADYMPKFVETIWTLLQSTQLHVKYDRVVSIGVQFLSDVASRSSYAHLFESPDALQAICQFAILPNVTLRMEDEELFEDNPDEYIKKDLEGSDSDTRRRSACDLIKSLSRSFEQQVVANFLGYTQSLLAEYESKGVATGWKAKDAAIYVTTALASKASTQKSGTTQLSQFVDVVSFFNTHVVPELLRHESPGEPSPGMDLLRASCLRFTLIFRNQLPIDVLTSVCEIHVLRLLKSKSYVVRSYAAVLLQKVFLLPSMTEGSPPALSRFAQTPIFANLAASLDAAAPNEYTMHCMLRCIQTLHPFLSDEGQVLTHAATSLLALMQEVARNPTKPFFNHYLFECLAVIVVATSSRASSQSMLQLLVKNLEFCMANSVDEFVGYCWQLLTCWLHQQSCLLPANQLSMPYSLVPMIDWLFNTSQAPWGVAGQIPALVDTVRIIIRIGGTSILDESRINQVLGVYQRLISVKSQDHFGVRILSDLLKFGNAAVILEKYAKPAFLVLFQRLSKARTVKFVRCLIVLFCEAILLHGPDWFIRMIDSIQPRMFHMVVHRIFVLDLPGLLASPVTGVPSTDVTAATANRNLLVVSAMCALISCESFCRVDENQGYLSTCWSSLVQSLIAALKGDAGGSDADTKRQVVSTPRATDGEPDGDSNSVIGEYDPAHCRLTYASGPSKDDDCFSQVPKLVNTRAGISAGDLLIQTLTKQIVADGRAQMFQDFIRTDAALNAEAKSTLKTTLNSVGIDI